MTLDITKPCQTRDGRKAECVGPVPGVPGVVVWKVKPSEGTKAWELITRFESGSEFWGWNAPGDIINVPEPEPDQKTRGGLSVNAVIHELKEKITILEGDNKILEASRDQWQQKATDWMHRYFGAKQFIRDSGLAVGRYLEGQP